jgi:hypothetical protein
LTRPGCLAIGACLSIFHAYGASGSSVAPTLPSPASRPTATLPAEQPRPLEETMNLWVDGRQDQAVEHFLTIDWGNLRFSRDSIFARKEGELMDMPQARWQALARDALEASRVLRQIGKQVTAQADQLAFERQYHKAERMLQAVRECGRVVSLPDSLAILRATGISIQKSALEKLISLCEAIDQPTRVAACRATLENIEVQQEALREEASQAPARAYEYARRRAAERVANSQPAH